MINSSYRKSARQPSATKKGPGRYHQQGHKHAGPPKLAGASKDFVQRVNPARQARKELRGAMSARQFRRVERFIRRNPSSGIEPQF